MDWKPEDYDRMLDHFANVWRRRRLPNWKRLTAPTAVIGLPVNGFSATVGVPVTLDPTNTTDPDDAWVGTWTITGVGAVVRFTYTGTFGNFASHITSWTPTIAEGVTIDWTVTDGSGQSDSAQVTGNVVPAGVPKLVLTTQPSASAQNGVNFGTNPVFQLRDAADNNLAIAGVSIVVTSSAGTLAMSPQPIVTDSSGAATPSTIKITGATGSYTISGGATGYTGVTSNPITLTPGTIVTAQCTAVVPASGQTGTGTAMTITARDTSGNALTTGGETFTVAVTGANTNSGSATDNGNGTYSRSYTPTAAGTDSIAITRSAVHISGSPFTSVVSTGNPFTPNLPGDYTLLDESPCSAATEGAWQNFNALAGSWTLRNGASYTPAQGNPPGAGPRSPSGTSNIYEARYTQNRSDGTPGNRSLTGVGAFNYRRLYIAGWFQLSSNWQGHNSSVNKVMIANVSGSPKMVLSATGTDANTLRWQFRLQNLGASEVSTANLDRNLGSAGDENCIRGVWHRVELIIYTGTAGNANGEVHMWVTRYNSNGTISAGPTKTHQYTNIQFVPSADASYQWSSPRWEPIWGGTGDTVAQEMYMWCDHMTVAGKL